MADPIGFYNSHYTGGEIDAAVGQIENKLDKPSGLDTAYKIVTTNNSSTGTLDYTDVPTGSTVMQRDANGRAQVEDGTSGKEIVNFAQLQAAIKTYKHTVIAQRNDGSMGWNGMAYFVAYSTSNLNINSVDNLKTVLGSSFIQPCNGYMKETADETNLCELITPSGFMIRTPTSVSYSTIAFDNTTFSDIVTTI